MSEFLQKGAKRALSLVQNKLGIYPLKDWDKNILSRHFNHIYGLYIVENTNNNKLLIGEGNIGRRIADHLRGNTTNSIFQKDIGNGHFFRMIGYIPCDNIEERKELEYYLHKYYKDSYNKPVVPKHLITRLYEEGNTKKEIKELLDCGQAGIDNNIKLPKTSEKLVYLDKRTNNNTWRIAFKLNDKKTNCITYTLGGYNTEKEAGENRDYFIIHKGFLDKSKLNYYDIDYNKFIPHKMRNGEMNSHIKEIYENQKTRSSRTKDGNRTNLQSSK